MLSIILFLLINSPDLYKSVYLSYVEVDSSILYFIYLLLLIICVIKYYNIFFVVLEIQLGYKSIQF